MPLFSVACKRISFSLFTANTVYRLSLFAIYFRTICESLQKRVSSVGMSNCFEIVFLRRIANTASCTSKRGIVFIGVGIDFNNSKIEICFLEHSEI